MTRAFGGIVVSFWRLAREFTDRHLLCGVSGAGAQEKEKAKGKRKIKQEEDEDYRELPQKKHKLYGRAPALSVLL